MSLLSCWFHVSKSNICGHMEQCSIGIKTMRELRQFFTFQDKLSLVYCYKIAGLIKSMGFEDDVFLWTHPAEVSKQYWQPTLSQINERTHEGPYVWWSTKRSWIVHQAVTEVNSCKLPGKPPKCGIREGNWRATEEFPSIWGTNVSQTALSTVTLELFSKELRRFVGKAGWVFSPRHLH